MWTGKSASGQEHSAYPRVSPSKGIAFTLVETLIITAILIVIFSALFSVFNLSNLSHSVVTAKLSLQADVRNIIEWVAKDARQTSGSQISGNNASSSHIKFRTCVGHNGTSLLWSGDFIEYNYNSSSQILTRTDHSAGRTWDFHNILTSPFNVSQVGDGILGITVDMQEDVFGPTDPRVNLTTEIKLRNG